MIKSFIVAGPYQVEDINGVHNDVVIGVVSPTALAGFGHKIEREVRKAFPLSRFKTFGTSAIVHNWSKLEGHPKFPPPKEATKGAPVLDEIKVRARMSFVYAVGCGVDPEDFDEEMQRIQSFLRSKMIGFSFGGGSLFLPRGLSEEEMRRSVRIALDMGTLKDRLRELPRGNVLFDRGDILSREHRGDGDTLDRVLSVLTRTKSEETGRYSAATKGFIVPTNVGFQAVEEPSDRLCPRDVMKGYKHVYAESVTSLGEYRSVRSLLTGDTPNPLHGSFWTHYSNPAAGTYYVSAIGAR